MVRIGEIPGLLVKRERKAKGWQQEVLARKLGITRQYIAVVEAKPRVSRGMTMRLDKAFGNTKWRENVAVGRGPLRVEVEPALAALYNNVSKDDHVTRGIIEILAEMKDRIDRIELRTTDNVIHMVPQPTRRRISELQN